MDWRRVVAYSATYLFWGASFLAIREIVAVAPPFLSAGVRFTVAGLILFFWLRRARRASRHVAAMAIVRGARADYVFDQLRLPVLGGTAGRVGLRCSYFGHHSGMDFHGRMADLGAVSPSARRSAAFSVASQE